MKLTKCSQSGFARQIDRYLNSVWYPICLGALCAFSGLGDSSRYTICMGLIAVTVFLTVLFSKDLKPLFAPMLMAFCALGKDADTSYWDQVGDVMRSYNDGAFSFVILLGILAVAALLIRFYKDGTLKDIWEKGGALGWGILGLDVVFLLNGVGCEYWVPRNLLYGALMAFGFTFFYFVCVSIARRGEDTAKYACWCMLFTALLGLFQVAVVLHRQGLLWPPLGVFSGEERNAVELGWGIITSICAYIILGIPAAFYLAANHKFAVLYYVLAFGIFGCIVILGCRGPILTGGLAMLLGIIGCCFGKNKKTGRVLALCTICCIAVGLLLLHLFVIPLPEAIKSFLEKARFFDIAEDGRIAIWGRGWDQFCKWPVLGVGFDRGGDVGIEWTTEIMQNVFANMYHNIGVQFLAAMGAMGGVACLFHFWQVGKLWCRPTATKVLLLTLPLMILLMSLFDNFFFYLNQQIAYCMFLGLAERENQ